MNQQKEKELYDLITAAMEGTISPEQHASLIEILSDDPEALERYSCYVSFVSVFRAGDILKDVDTEAESVRDIPLLTALAEYEKTAPVVEIPKEEIEEESEPVIRPLKKKPLSKLQIAAIVTSAAAMLLFALFIKFVPEPLPSVEVATLVDQMNVQWSESSLEPEVGSRLWTNEGSLELEKGIVSIKYDKSAKIIVEGPALFKIERSGVYLEHGYVYSNVSETSLGFTVETPTSRFVDMGTEFGVLAEVDGSSEVHVTKGKVQLFAGLKGKSRTSRIVTEDMAVRFSAASGLVKNIPIRRTAFVRKIDSASNSVWKGQQLPSDTPEWQHHTVWKPSANPALDAIVDGKANWNNPNNWTAGVPGLTGVDTKVSFFASRSAECIVSDAQNCAFLGIDRHNVIRIVDGGKLTVTTGWMAVGYDSPGTLIVEAGGVCDVAVGDLMVGYENTDNCTVQINGGTVRVAGDLEVGKYNSTGKVYVNEGVLEFSRFSGVGFETGSLIDIKFGTVIVNEYQRKKIEAFIADGRLTAFGGAGSVVYDHDVTNSGKTTITARQKTE